MPRGRPRNPSKLKAFRGEATDDGAEPQPLAGTPKPPRDLSKARKKLWKEVVRVLAPAGILTMADATIMLRFVVAWDTYLRADAAVLKSGEVLQGANKGFYQNPFLAVRNRAGEDMGKLSTLLGLDPSSRSRLRINVGPKAADPENKARFFKAREGQA
jgi:P27 family predicted phage terminase small subunit